MKPQVGVDLLTDVSLLIPEEIPEDFYNPSNPYVKQTSKWFHLGMARGVLKVKPGINKLDALRHTSAIMRSFGLKHEYKIAAVAYLMNEWFDFA